MIRRPPICTRTHHSFPTRRSADLDAEFAPLEKRVTGRRCGLRMIGQPDAPALDQHPADHQPVGVRIIEHAFVRAKQIPNKIAVAQFVIGHARSEEHTSELQSLMRNSYAVFCLKKKKNNNTIQRTKNKY